MSMMRFLILVAVVMGGPLVSGANVPDVYGVGSRAVSLGGAFTAVADDFSATWYNPAGLALLDRAELAISPVGGVQQVWFRDPGQANRDAGLPGVSGVHFGLAGPMWGGETELLDSRSAPSPFEGVDSEGSDRPRSTAPATDVGVRSSGRRIAINMGEGKAGGASCFAVVGDVS